MINAALVLEGGALRILFSAGVADVFLEHGIRFSYVNGVSAGSMCGMNYVSGQAGRMLRVNTEYLHDKRYINISPRHLLRDRSVFSFDFMFGELSDTLIPFDYEAFEQSPQRYEVVATRCVTGKPEFFEKGVCGNIYGAAVASSSMPLFSKMAEVDGKRYLDGGVSLPIAYQRAMDLGYEKVVLILTRAAGYRKKPVSRMRMLAYERYFGPLPNLLDALFEVPERYNRMQEEIDELERAGRLLVIRPEKPVRVSRTERDGRKLLALYEEGRAVACARLPEILAYLGGGDV